MPVKIEAKEQPLSKTFSNDYAFSIPLYQRPYAWTTEQAGELLSDLVSFLDDDSKPVSELNPYFLGSIVLIKGDTPEADIVDGQQRLATLTILLAALRVLVPKEYADGLTGFLYEQGNLIVGTPNRYRLKLSKRDEEFFRTYVQDPDGLSQLLQLNSAQLTDSRKNFQANARYFLESENGLNSLSETQRVRLLQYVMQRCYLVVVSTPDLESAYRIFSVLNTRGLDLGLTDILKAEIVGTIPEDQQETYTHIWEDEEEDLGRDAFQELFAHIRMIHRKAKPRESALAEFRKYIQPAKEPRRFIDEVLKPYSDAFEVIKDASYQSDRRAEEVNTLFRWLNQIDNFDWVPPAILCLSQYRHQPDHLVTFFTDLERLAAGLMIRRADINERLERYGRLLAAIEVGQDLSAPKSPLQLTPEECSEIVNILNSDLYLMKRINKYILLRLDSVLSDAEASYDYPVISVEHVLPQKPDSDSVWVKWFPDEEQRKGYVHKVGNLVLLSRRKNSQAQNFDFERKRQLYFVTRKGISPFALTTQVLQEAEWTPSVIERRQAELIGKFKTLWRL